MTDAEPTYESQLELIGSLHSPASADERTIKWCDARSRVGVARDPVGRLEIFLEGPRIEAQSSIVRENLEHERWYRDGGSALVANRLLLPAAEHYGRITAFLCTELLRNGASSDPVGGFRRTEPLIEIAIQRLRIADQTILGLCGELIVLRSLVDQVAAAHVREVLHAWAGHRDTPRDIQLGKAGLEIKTTTAATSSHHVQGVHQMEPGHGVDGAEEAAFLLASLGLSWAGAGDEADSATLPEIVDALLDRIRATQGVSAGPIEDELLARIREYGAASEIGYDHSTMAASAAFSQRFRLSFARFYDMSDPAVRVLRSVDLEERPFIDAGSLRCRIDLPSQVTGDLNPVHGLVAGCSRFLVLAGGRYEEL
jgi:hypothetical protein